jgi:hypothetical protein
MKTQVNLKKIDARRAGAIALSLGLAGIGLDAAVAHFAGREMKSPAQLVPVIAAALMLVIVPFAWKATRTTTLSIMLRIAGVLSAIVGVLGTAFHARVFMQLLEDQPLTWEVVEAALYVAPPLAAPGAFIAAGGLLLLLASPRLELAIKPRVAAAVTA